MILVTGLTGMLGNYVKRELDNQKINYTHLSRKELDISNIQSVNAALKGKKFSHFIHLAAETDVDLCESNPAHAYICNYYTPKLIAQHCNEIGAKLIFISTSGVFGNQDKIHYCELDTPSPLSQYGKTKYMAEQAIQLLCKNHLIIRASWMIGGGEKLDNKFVGKIIAKLKSGTSSLNAVCDKIGSVTSGKHLAKFIINSLDTSFTGIKHIASYDFCSRYEIAKLITSKIKPSCEVFPSTSSLFPLPAPRSLSEALYSVVPQGILPTEEISWSTILLNYITEEFDVI